MAQSHTPLDLTPWTPTPTTVPPEWMDLVDMLVYQVQGSHRAHVLNVTYDAYKVGELLRSWGLPWQVVMAGYLWEHEEEQIRGIELCDTDRVLGHIAEANRYGNYINDENLSPLLNPPYHDIGGLLIAVAMFYQSLQTLQQQSNGKPYADNMQIEIEHVGRTLLNIAKRLGMWYFKREIEDLIEQLCWPGKFADTRLELASILERDAGMLEETRQLFMKTYREATGQDINVIYTQCGAVGLERRLQDAHTTVTSQKEKAQLTGFDLVTFDVIVPTVHACYTALGVLSQSGYIQDRVTDQLANPKTNGCSHIALGLILKSQNIHPHHWMEADTYVCQLQIATHLMQAITGYGCLHPRCYELYAALTGKESELSSMAQTWNGEEGKVFLTIKDALTSHQLHPDAEKPITVYTKNRRPIMLPEGATALDFAYALDSSQVKYAVEAFINNRKAPLYCVLDAGDIVEIRISKDSQVQNHWLDEDYAYTPSARSYIKDLLHPQHKGYEKLLKELEDYDYTLISNEIERELRPILKQYDLGTPREYLERLGVMDEPPYTPQWAAQRIIQQMARRNEPLLADRGRSNWIAVLDRQSAANTLTFRQQRYCRSCQPTYPRDQQIVGRVRKKTAELIVHKKNCSSLAGHSRDKAEEWLPMVWEPQPRTVRVALFIRAQDRPGLILDIARCLRQHPCTWLFLNAEVLRFVEVDIRLTLETYEEQKVLYILQDLRQIANIAEVKLDPTATPTSTYEYLQKLIKRPAGPTAETRTDRLWKERLKDLQPRNSILKNPFDISRPASAKMFYGRTTEMRAMERELCEGEHGKALILYGPRRSGKSSICKHFIEQQARQPSWGVLFSLQAAQGRKEEEIFAQLAEEVSREFNEQLQQAAPCWQDYTDSDSQVRFRRLVQDCLSRVPGTRLVLALDEFGAALESYQKHFLEYRFFTYWRDLMSEVPQLSLLLALPTSSHNLLISEGFANAFSFAQPLPVDFLDKESAEQLLVDPLNSQHIAVHPNAVLRAIQLTGGNPYYMTLIGGQLISQLNKETPKQQVLSEDLRLAVDQIIEMDANQNFSFYQAELQAHLEFRILEAMVELTSQAHQPEVQFRRIVEVLNLPAQIVRGHLERLRNGLILEEHHAGEKSRPSSNPSYSFKIELFRLWLVRNHWFFLESPFSK